VSTTSFSSWLKSTQPKLPLDGALAVVRLADAGATLPFIARYRKEQTGNLTIRFARRVDLKRRSTG
jgi:transcriptional accessory protein Tex/SPT6